MNADNTQVIHLGRWTETCNSIRRLDPLHFDAHLTALHRMNEQQDVQAIMQLLYNLLPVPAALEQYTFEDSAAAMRDLGIMMGILKRHQIEPVEVVPELEYVLLVLMTKTALPPRDTLIHYTVWNPDGVRSRSYTGIADEICLIESVKMAYPSLLEAIDRLHAMHQGEVYGRQFEEQCLYTRDLMVGMVKGIVHAKRYVRPEVFAHELRHYYNPIKVDYGREYMGPGAVEMPMFLFDHLLWSCDLGDTTYYHFQEGYLPYNFGELRDLYWSYRKKPSLVSRVEYALLEHPTRERADAARQLLEMTQVLKSFRMPHKKLAEESYREAEGHAYNKGSGGYSVDILHHILTLQHHRLNSLNNILVQTSSKATVV